MGYYVNPPNETKEDFLAKHGTPASINIAWKDVPDGSLPVILVNNRAFSAAGIAYDAQELEAFREPGDVRPKTLYLVDVEKLYPVSDLKRRT